MDSAWENLIKYFMTICAAGAIIWKGIDAWEKRKTSNVSKLEGRCTELEEHDKDRAQELRDLKSDLTSQKVRIDGFYDRLVQWLKQ